jgi:hypothetical protein
MYSERSRRSRRFTTCTSGVVEDSAYGRAVLNEAETHLRRRFGINHSTLQLDIGGACGQAAHDRVHSPT